MLKLLVTSALVITEQLFAGEVITGEFLGFM